MGSDPLSVVAIVMPQILPYFERIYGNRAGNVLSTYRRAGVSYQYGPKSHSLAQVQGQPTTHLISLFKHSRVVCNILYSNKLLKFVRIGIGLVYTVSSRDTHVRLPLVVPLTILGSPVGVVMASDVALASLL